MNESHDCIVIGGGQAGLAASYYLTQLDREHVVLERRRIAERWRTERWDSLAFQLPAWSIHLPGYAYSGPRDSFPLKDEIVGFLERYAVQIAAPVRCGVDVLEVAQNSDCRGFVVRTPNRMLSCRTVIIATGPFTVPRIPEASGNLPPDIVQMHASAYRNARQFPDGAVLVVGAGASGCQIAEDLHEQGRHVYFSISRHRRSLRRYRGRDFVWWLEKLGTMDLTREKLLAGGFDAPIVLTGAGGGRDIDVRHFPRRGVRLLGYLRSIDGAKIRFRDDVHVLLRQADDAIRSFLAAADSYARLHGLTIPEEDRAKFFSEDRHVDTPGELNLRDAGVSTIIWASGYADDYAWLKLPILDAQGRPAQERGVSACPGAYFLGLKWMHKLRSSFLCGVGEDAAFIAQHIASRRH